MQHKAITAVSDLLVAMNAGWILVQTEARSPIGKPLSGSAYHLERSGQVRGIENQRIAIVTIQRSLVEPIEEARTEAETRWRIKPRPPVRLTPRKPAKKRTH